MIADEMFNILNMDKIETDGFIEYVSRNGDNTIILDIRDKGNIRVLKKVPSELMSKYNYAIDLKIQELRQEKKLIRRIK